MPRETPAALASAALIIWLVALAAIILWKLFTRSIDLSGLLDGDRANGETYFSPGRVQLLIATLLFAMHVLTQVVAHPTSFPVIPHEFLLALGGSQAVYLGGKARAMLR